MAVGVLHDGHTRARSCVGAVRVAGDGTTSWAARLRLRDRHVDGPAGRFEGLNLRLYNPASRQWSLNFASSRGGTLGPPSIGQFSSGRGEFYSQETLDGRAILVRFVISDATPNPCFVVSTTTPNVCRFEQAFSEDGGRTWEVDWIATDTRLKQ